MKRDKVIFVTGPTAIGKSSMAIKVAKEFNGEIINADSVQCYKYYNIGSAKTTLKEMDGIVHHLVDVFEPEENFDVKKFQNHANKLIKDIISRGKTPVVSGGTGLYITALMQNYDLSDIKRDPSFAQSLADISTQSLYEDLIIKDRDAAQSFTPQNRKRIIRALEIYSKGLKKSQILQSKWNYTPILVTLFCQDREIIYEKINTRVDEMIDEGLLDEVSSLYAKYPNAKPTYSMGYKEFIPHIKGEATLEDCIINLKKNTRNYAKKQITWLRNKLESNWFDYKAEKKILNFIKQELNK